MGKIIVWGVVLSIGLAAGPALGQGLGTGLRIDPARRSTGPGEISARTGYPLRDATDGVENELIQLRSGGELPDCLADRAIWTEGYVEHYAASGQGLVDVIMGGDGYLYCAYYDDGLSGSGYGAVYVKRSSDGGATWANPDAGSNGFALYDMFTDRPSIEVWQTAGGAYRMAVATSAPWPYTTSPNDIIVAWKDIGGTDVWTTVTVQNDTSENYIGPRLKAVRRPSNPAYKRLLCSSYGYSDGRLWGDYTDLDATAWGSYAAINPATDQVNVWRADFIEDVNNNRLFCVWSVAVSATPDNPRVVTALSTNRGQSWFATLYAISPTGWNSCAESDAAIATNPAQADRTLMVVWSGIQTAGQQFDMRYSYQFLDVITVAGSSWQMSPAGHPVTYGTLYSDADGDNTMPAIMEDNRLGAGGYRVAFLDEFGASAGRVRYSECAFDTPVSWLAAEVVTGAGADPARQGSSALSMGVGYSENPAYSTRRCAVWPDFRDPETPPNVYCAWADMSGLPPTATPSPEPTLPPLPSATPTPTVSPSPTAVPTGPPIPTLTPTPSPAPTAVPPIPAAGPTGLGLLLAGLGLLLARRRR